MCISSQDSFYACAILVSGKKKEKKGKTNWISFVKKCSTWKANQIANKGSCCTFSSMATVALYWTDPGISKLLWRHRAWLAALVLTLPTLIGHRRVSLRVRIMTGQRRMETDCESKTRFNDGDADSWLAGKKNTSGVVLFHAGRPVRRFQPRQRWFKCMHSVCTS